MKKSRKNKRRLLPIFVIAGIIVACAITAICYGMMSSDKKVDKDYETETINIVQNNNPSENESDDYDNHNDYDYTLSNSSSPYMVKVNRAANCVTVYAKDEGGHYTVPVKAILCSTGKKTGDTPLGTFTTSDKYDWRLMVDGTYSQYAYRIEGEIMFHSVPCFDDKKDELEYKEYNKLGTPASLGCIRMTVRDAKWIYDNCPKGTTVVIYDDADNPGPLGKPESIKIPENSKYSGWDPTDPDPKNPWLSCYPVISNAIDLTIKAGSSTNLLKHITAVDTCGNDISKNVGITGDYDLSKPGIYTVTYTVTDILGKTTSVSACITVTDMDIATTPIEPATPVRETTSSRKNTDYDNYRYTTTAPETTTTPQETTVPTHDPTEPPTEPPTEAPTTTEPPTTTKQQTTTPKPTQTEPPTTTQKQTKEPSPDDSTKKASNPDGNTE